MSSSSFYPSASTQDNKNIVDFDTTHISWTLLQCMTDMAAQRRGPWSTKEDNLLMTLVDQYGALNWVRIAQFIDFRTPKQCRERYHQNLKPSLNHGPITPIEGKEIERLVGILGKRWAEISRRIEGRSDNAVKNWWNGNQNRLKRQDRRRAAHLSQLAAAANQRDVLATRDPLPGDGKFALSDRTAHPIGSGRRPDIYAGRHWTFLSREGLPHPEEQCSGNLQSSSRDANLPSPSTSEPATEPELTPSQSSFLLKRGSLPHHSLELPPLRTLVGPQSRMLLPPPCPRNFGTSSSSSQKQLLTAPNSPVLPMPPLQQQPFSPNLATWSCSSQGQATQHANNQTPANKSRDDRMTLSSVMEWPATSK